MPPTPRERTRPTTATRWWALLAVSSLAACGSTVPTRGTGGVPGSGGTGGGQGDAAGGAGGSGSGGIAAGGTGSGGRGGDGASGGVGGSIATGTVPVYEPPSGPVLAGGACRFAAAPAASLCAGRAGCPVLVDAQFGGDAATRALDLVATDSGGAHLVFAGTYPAGASHCLFTVDPAGAATITADPFGGPPASPGASGAAVALGNDSRDRPHAFMSAGTGLRHFHTATTGWTSETLPLPVAHVDANVWSALSMSGGMFALVGSHPPDAGYYRSFNLHLFSSTDDGGSWQTTRVFDGGGTQELLGAAALSVDAAGQVVATYDTRLDLAGGGLGYAAYLWRGGSTATLSTPSPTWQGEMLRTPGDAASKDSVVKVTDGEGVHLVFPRVGQLPRALVVPGTTAAALTGCPVSFAAGMPPTCSGHAGASCTLKGASLIFASQPQRTDDGAVWFLFARQDVEQDVVLRQYTSGVSDPLMYCTADVKADRTTTNLYVARVAAGAAATAEVRLRIPLGGPGSSLLTTEARVRPSGNKLVLAYRFGAANAPYRYLVFDTGRL